MDFRNAGEEDGAFVGKNSGGHAIERVIETSGEDILFSGLEAVGAGRGGGLEPDLEREVDGLHAPPLAEEDGALDDALEIRLQTAPAARPYGFEIPAEGIDIEELERQLIVQAMERSGWVIARAARLLGLTYRTLQYRLEKFGIRKPA